MHLLRFLIRFVVCLAGGLVGGIFLAIVGLVVGAGYGGNYATDFEFNGVRGYEATGQIGAIIGFAVGTPLCVFLLLCGTKAPLREWHGR